MKIYSPKDAWEAFDLGNYELALHIWLSLCTTATDVDTLTRYQHGYLAVLMAQSQYREAMALLEELFENTKDHVCLHQLGCLAKQLGQIERARTHFMAEQVCLDASDHVGLSLNAYELGAIALLQEKFEVAFHYAGRSLDFAKQSNNAIALAYAYYQFSEVNQALGEAEAAKNALEAAKQIWSQKPALPLRETGEPRLVPLLLQGFPLVDAPGSKSLLDVHM